jgi:hypothetical protein
MKAIVSVLLFDKGHCFLDHRDGIILVRAIRSGGYSDERARTYESRNRRYHTATTFEPPKACASAISRSLRLLQNRPIYIILAHPRGTVAGRKDHTSAPLADS